MTALALVGVAAAVGFVVLLWGCVAGAWDDPTQPPRPRIRRPSRWGQ